jgi:transcriptional regulator with PAS, ATPase and Fis domain
MPPLRDRIDDLPLLVTHFLKKYSQKIKKQIDRVEPDVLDRLYRYSWAGNIRELENVIESAIAIADPPAITLEYLPSNLQEKIRTYPRKTRYADMTYEAAKELFEQEYFYELLRRSKGNAKTAAEIAGVSEKSISRRKQRFEFENKMFEGGPGTETSEPVEP